MFTTSEGGRVPNQHKTDRPTPDSRQTQIAPGPTIGATVASFAVPFAEAARSVQKLRPVQAVEYWDDPGHACDLAPHVSRVVKKADQVLGLVCPVLNRRGCQLIRYGALLDGLCVPLSLHQVPQGVYSPFWSCQGNYVLLYVCTSVFLI
jgi:hypothetical protein